MRKRLSEREMQGMLALIALRAAAQQMDNALNEWLADTAGSFARLGGPPETYRAPNREVRDDHQKGVRDESRSFPWRACILLGGRI